MRPTHPLIAYNAPLMFEQAFKNIDDLLDCVHRELTDTDLAKITSIYHAWRSAPPLNSQPSTLNSSSYATVAGFCKSAATGDIASHSWVLTPSRYVGAEEVADDSDPIKTDLDQPNRPLPFSSIILQPSDLLLCPWFLTKNKAAITKRGVRPPAPN